MNGISGINGNSHHDRMSGMNGIDSRPPPPRSEDPSMSGIEGQGSLQGFDFSNQEAGQSSGFDFASAPPPPPPPHESYNAATDTATTSAEDQMTDMMESMQAMLDNIFSLFSTDDDTSTY